MFFLISEITYHDVTDVSALYVSLKNECESPVMFAINRNLYAYVKIVDCKLMFFFIIFMHVEMFC